MIEKNIPVLEAVAEVLLETRNEFDTKLGKSAEQLATLKESVDGSIKTVEEKQTELTEQVSQSIEEVKESVESGKVAIEAVVEEKIAQATQEIAEVKESVEQAIEEVQAKQAELSESVIKTLEATKESIEAKQNEEIIRIAEEVKRTTEETLATVKSGENGLDGRDGRDGVDGRDRPLIDVLTIDAKDKVEKNAVVAHKGGLFVSGRKANGDPDSDPSAYNCILNGVEGVGFNTLDQRKTVIAIKMSDGLHIEHILENHSPIFKGTFNKEATYEIGDIIIKDRKTLIKVSDEGEAQWKMFTFSEKGDKGDSGIQGEKGVAGVGIKDVIAEKNNLLFEFDDGTVKSVQVGLPELNGGFEGQEIKSFRGFYKGDQQYSSGEIVRLGNALWIATTSTNAQPNAMGGDWTLMFQSGSTGISGAPPKPPVNVGDYATIVYVDEGDTATLASAKNYADTQDATTLASAKTYTDGKTGVSTDAGNSAKLGTDNKIFVPAQSAGANLPLVGGTMSGTIASPIATPMSFMNTYSLFSASGGVSFRFGASDLIAFSSTFITAYKPIVTTTTGIGIQFGTGGADIRRGANANEMEVWAGGAKRANFSNTAFTYSVPLVLPADPTTALEAVTKRYVDALEAKVTALEARIVALETPPV